MLNSNIPLNQNLVEAINLDKDKDQYEGGEVQDYTPRTQGAETELGLNTDRAMITQEVNLVGDYV